MVHLIIRSAQEEQLAARIFEFIFKPGFTDGFRRNESANRKLLRDKDTFERPDRVSKDENVAAINEIIRRQRFQSGNRSAHRQMQIRFRTVTWRSLALALAVLVHPHGHVTAFRQPLQQQKVGVIRLEVRQGIAAQAADKKYGWMPSRIFGLGNDGLIVSAVYPDGAVESFHLRTLLGKNGAGEHNQ